MKHVLEIVFNFNMKSFFKFCDCLHIKHIIFTSQAPGQPAKISLQLKSWYSRSKRRSSSSTLNILCTDKLLIQFYSLPPYIINYCNIIESLKVLCIWCTLAWPRLVKFTYGFWPPQGFLCRFIRRKNQTLSLITFD